MIETALFFIFAAAMVLMSLSIRRKTYGAGKWPQPITEARENPNFGVNKMPIGNRPKPTPTPPKKLYARKTEGWDG